MKPQKITTRDRIRGAAEKWREQYDASGEGRWDSYGGPEKRAIYERLCELDLETCTAAEVDKIIGNGSWTELRCDACRKVTGAVVVVGEEPDYESRTAQLCYGCMIEAFAAFDCTAHEDCREHPHTLGRECAARAE